MDWIEMLKVIVLGLVEGVTEWLPVSSTGHLLLVQKFWPLDQSAAFTEMFNVVIQLGAILAVVVLFWNKLFPFVGRKKVTQENGDMVTVKGNIAVLSVGNAFKKFGAHAKLFFQTIGWNLHGKKGEKPVLAAAGKDIASHAIYIKKEVLWMWWMVFIACIPTAAVGFWLDDLLGEYFNSAFVISLMLILYGIAFIVVETWNKRRTPRIGNMSSFKWQTAFLIGLFQCLAMIPGTSRSGATIIGALIIGVSRTCAAEYTFFLAIPTMFGASLFKLVKFFLKGGAMGGEEIAYLLVGMLVSFLVSLFVIRFLMSFIRKHDFKVFGWYRIALGVVIIVIFAVVGGLFDIIA